MGQEVSTDSEKRMEDHGLISVWQTWLKSTTIHLDILWYVDLQLYFVTSSVQRCWMMLRSRIPGQRSHFSEKYLCFQRSDVSKVGVPFYHSVGIVIARPQYRSLLLDLPRIPNWHGNPKFGLNHLQSARCRRPGPFGWKKHHFWSFSIDGGPTATQ